MSNTFKSTETFSSSAKFIEQKEPFYSEIFFHSYGCNIRLESRFGLVLEQIRKDFGYFESLPTSNIDIQIHVHNKASEPPAGFIYPISSSLSLRTVQNSLRRRTVIFSNQSQCEIFDGPKFCKAKITSSVPELAYEITFLTLHSLLGSHLEARGIMRTHAGAFQFENQSFVFFGDSGAGKSYLLRRFLELQFGPILSDETTLVDVKNMMLLPFPLRISEKIDDNQCASAIRVALFKNRNLHELNPTKVSSPCPWNGKIFWLQRQNHPLQRTASIKRSIFLGLGLMQMHEIAIRPLNLKKLLRIFYYRLILVSKITRTQNVFRHELEPDLFGFLKSQNP